MTDGYVPVPVGFLRDLARVVADTRRAVGRIEGNEERFMSETDDALAGLEAGVTQIEADDQQMIADDQATIAYLQGKEATTGLTPDELRTLNDATARVAAVDAQIKEQDAADVAAGPASEAPATPSA